MPHIFALRLLGEMKVMAPRITAVQRAMVLFSRKYGRACYRDIANECGISKSSAATICVRESIEKKLVKNVTKNSSSMLTSRKG